MNREFYDNHCLVKFLGKMWYIVGVKPGLFQVVRIEGLELVGAVIDVSGVDWEDYCREAVAILQARYG